MNRILLILCLMIMLASCQPGPYIAANMYETASRHKTVAILSPQVSMELRPRQMRRTSPGELKDMEMDLAEDMHMELCSWISRKERYMHYSARFQDIKTTQAKLAQAHIDYWTMMKMSPKELAAVLG